jgi:mannose-6-phosphate isomerase
VHPSKEEAVIGFEREEAAAIPITAPNRNYKDRNHKPELMVALSDFWLLHGFKPEADILKTLTAVRQLNFLGPHFDKGGYKMLFSFVMQMEQGEVDTVIDSLARQVMPLYKQNKIDKHKEDFWAARAIDTFCSEPPYDRGIFCIYLFNLLHLKKGQGIYQPAGMPHAYLEGQNVEIMANSDNVLRAGLTDKHIDVSELLKHTVCTPTIPDVLHYTGGSEITYPSPANEFALQQYHLKGEEKKLYTESAEILFVIEGNVKIATEAESLSIQKGESVFIMADTDIILQCDASAVVFRASVGAV